MKGSRKGSIKFTQCEEIFCRNCAENSFTAVLHPALSLLRALVVFKSLGEKVLLSLQLGSFGAPLKELTMKLNLYSF